MEGNQFLGKSTIVAGRSVMGLSGAIVLVDVLRLDISNLTVLNIPVSEVQYSAGTLVVLALLWVSLLVHWLGDLAHLGWWRLASAAPKLEGMDDVGFDFPKQVTRVCDILSGMDKRGETSREQQVLIYHLQRVAGSYWFYNTYGRFYVIGWGFSVPTVLAMIASILVSDSLMAQ